jgi:hypothetical protein
VSGGFGHEFWYTHNYIYIIYIYVYIFSYIYANISSVGMQWRHVSTLYNLYVQCIDPGVSMSPMLLLAQETRSAVARYLVFIYIYIIYIIYYTYYILYILYIIHILYIILYILHYYIYTYIILYYIYMDQWLGIGHGTWHHQARWIILDSAGWACGGDVWEWNTS